MNTGLLNHKRPAWGKLAGLLLLVLTFGPLQRPCRGADEDVIQIKLATLLPKATSGEIALQRMAEGWRRVSNGKVKLNILASYSAGGEAAMVDKMGVGGVDAAAMTTVGLKMIDPATASLGSIPMMYQSLEEYDYVLGQLEGDLEKRLLAKGYVALFWCDIGWVRFFSKSPMTHPDDLKRMKVFAWAGQPEQLEIMREAGFKPVALETAEIHRGLSSGIIEVVPTAPFYANAAQYASSAKYLLEVNWAPLAGGAVIRKSTWDRVPVAHREAMLKLAREAGLALTTAARKESDQAVQAMKIKHGLTVQRASPEITAEWVAAARSAYPKIRGRLVPAEMFDRIEKSVQTYRTSKIAEK